MPRQLTSQAEVAHALRQKAKAERVASRLETRAAELNSRRHRSERTQRAWERVAFDARSMRAVANDPRWGVVALADVF